MGLMIPFHMDISMVTVLAQGGYLAATLDLIFDPIHA